MRNWLTGCGSRLPASAIRARLSDADCEALLYDWHIWAREDQLPPPGPWSTWLLLGGRGAGKTRAGAEWVRGMALGLDGFAAQPAMRFALVGETLDAVRAVMIEGVSGLLAVHAPSERPAFEASKQRLVWPNGAIAELFSANRPDSLRGPQFDAAWCDELAKWRYPEATFDMLQFGLRLGDRPRQIVTTTPRPLPLLQRLLADPACVTDRAASRANRAFLADGFIERIEAQYGGSRLARQELDAEILSEREDALWQRGQIDGLRVKEVPSDLARVVVAVDPPASSGVRSDACGLVAAGIDGAGQGYVLADATLDRAAPLAWAQQAVRLYHEFAADRLLAEVNQGGEMVRTLIHQVDANVPVKMVRAMRGKYLRAEPVAALYEQGRVRHVGSHPLLEDEMCDFGPLGLSSGRSPDRLDALVWALSDLMLDGRAEPRVRRV